MIKFHGTTIRMIGHLVADFLVPNHPLWKRTQVEHFSSYSDRSGFEYSLGVSYIRGECYLVWRTGHPDRDYDTERELYPIAKPDAGLKLLDLDDNPYPACSFMNGELAHKIAMDFMNCPNRPSNEVDWIDGREFPYQQFYDDMDNEGQDELEAEAKAAGIEFVREEPDNHFPYREVEIEPFVQEEVDYSDH